MQHTAELQVAKRTGATIEVIAEDENGDIDIPALEKLVSSGPRKPALIALVHVPSNCGVAPDMLGRPETLACSSQ